MSLRADPSLRAICGCGSLFGISGMLFLWELLRLENTFDGGELALLGFTVGLFIGFGLQAAIASRLAPLQADPDNVLSARMCIVLSCGLLGVVAASDFNRSFPQDDADWIEHSVKHLSHRGGNRKRTYIHVSKNESEADTRSFPLPFPLRDRLAPGDRVWMLEARQALGDDASDLIDEELANRPADAPTWTQIFRHLLPDDVR